MKCRPLNRSDLRSNIAYPLYNLRFGFGPDNDSTKD